MNKVSGTIFVNEIKLLFFIALISAIIVFFGYIISSIFGFGLDGIIVSIIIASAVNLFSYFFSKNIVLKSQKAIPIKESEYPEYYNMVKNMCEKNNIRFPELYYINTPSMNAFATGRNQKNAAVCITSGMLKNTPMDEISGVIGHELSHILHKDIMITSFISVMLGCITIMASVLRNSAMYGGSYGRNSSRNSSNSPVIILALILSILAPFVALLIRMAISRSREYMADATGGTLCGNPHLLAKALYRISHNGSELPQADEATAPMYISNPLKPGILANLFSTHPDINDRIKRLENMI